MAWPSSSARRRHGGGGRGGTVTGTPSIHSIPESDGPAPPVREVSSVVSIRRPTLCRSMISAAVSAPGAPTMSPGLRSSVTVMRELLHYRTRSSLIREFTMVDACATSSTRLGPGSRGSPWRPTRRRPAGGPRLTRSTSPRGGHVHALGLGEALHRAGNPVHLFALGDPAKGLYRPVD